MVGLAAGTISTLGFAMLSPLLEEKTGLGDTCGVHNLHGIPGLLGGLVRSCLCHFPSLLHLSTRMAGVLYGACTIMATCRSNKRILLGFRERS